MVQVSARHGDTKTTVASKPSRPAGSVTRHRRPRMPPYFRTQSFPLESTGTSTASDPQSTMPRSKTVRSRYRSGSHIEATSTLPRTGMSGDPSRWQSKWVIGTAATAGLTLGVLGTIYGPSAYDAASTFLAPTIERAVESVTNCVTGTPQERALMDGAWWLAKTGNKLHSTVLSHTLGGAWDVRKWTARATGVTDAISAAGSAAYDCASEYAASAATGALGLAGTAYTVGWEGAKSAATEGYSFIGDVADRLGSTVASGITTGTPFAGIGLGSILGGT